MLLFWVAYVKSRMEAPIYITVLISVKKYVYNWNVCKEQTQISLWLYGLKPIQILNWKKWKSDPCGSLSNQVIHTVNKDNFSRRIWRYLFSQCKTSNSPPCYSHIAHADPGLLQYSGMGAGSGLKGLLQAGRRKTATTVQMVLCKWELRCSLICPLKQNLQVLPRWLIPKSNSMKWNFSIFFPPIHSSNFVY